jgi:hypothetical protein
LTRWIKDRYLRSMPRFQRLTRLIALLLCAWPAASLSKSITERPDELVASFVAVWNTHDPPAFGRLMAIDADWVTASGGQVARAPRS